MFVVEVRERMSQLVVLQNEGGDPVERVKMNPRIAKMVSASGRGVVVWGP